MIMSYLTERRSWIALIIGLQALTLFIAYIDAEIPILPVLYINFLSGLVFAIFLIFRYMKETKYYKSLAEWDNSLDLTQTVEAESPFEKIIEESILNQTNRLKTTTSEHLFSLEQEKDELLTWIHEVKTPLTAMHLMIDRMKDDQLKSQLNHEWLRIHLLLDQQLHQKRIPFMKNDLYMETVHLKELLFKEIKTLQSWCLQKGIGFDFDLQEADVVSDSKWLAFMLRQLLTNAIKYSEHSDIHISSVELNGHIMLSIKDWGRGIDAKDLPRIFEKGFTSTTHHYDHNATGMGLYLTKRTAETLHIQIDVQSEAGTGTTFTLTFPQRNELVRITGM